MQEKFEFTLPRENSEWAHFLRNLATLDVENIGY